MSENTAVSPVKYMLSGYFAGICAVGVEHPLEMGMRTFPPSTPVTMKSAPALLTHLVKTLQSDGLKSVYKGSSSRFSIAGSSTALTFFGYGFGRRLLQSKPTDQLSFPGYFIAGAFAGLVKQLVIPLKNEKELWYLLKNSLQKFDIQGTYQIIKRVNLKNIYDSPRYFFYKEVAITGLLFMTYDGLRGLMVHEDKRSNVCIFRTMIAGGMAGVAFSAANIFADSASSRIATSPGIKVVDSLTSLVKENGVLAFYRGYAPTIIRSFSSSAACFLGFQFCLSTLNWIAPDPI